MAIIPIDVKFSNTVEAIPRPSTARPGQLAVATTRQSGAAAGWTRVAATGGAGSVYWRIYDGTTADTFPSLENPLNASVVPRLLSVWDGALGVEDVWQDVINHGINPSPGSAFTLPSRTTTRRAATYVWHGTNGQPPSWSFVNQNPVPPLQARFSGVNSLVSQGNGRAFYVSSVPLDAVGPTGTFTQRFVANFSGGSTGEDFTFILIPNNLPPNAPTLLSPAMNQPLSKDEVNRLTWQISDPNPGDSQGRANVRYRVGTAAWTVQPVAGPNQLYDVPAGTFGNVTVEWQVQTFDAEGLEGPYSSSRFFVAGTRPPGPAITNVVNGQTVSDTPLIVEWSSAGGATDFQIRRVEDEAGVPGAEVYFTSPELLASAGQAYALDLPVNSRFEHVQLREKVAGLWSDWAASSKRILVSYTTPGVPSLSVTPVKTLVYPGTSTPVPGNFTDALRHDYAPTVIDGGPAVVGMDLYLRSVGSADRGLPFTETGTRVARALPTTGTYLYQAPASGVEYESRLVAVAANGTTSTSPWISDAVDLVPGTPGDPGDEGDYADASYSPVFYD